MSCGHFFLEVGANPYVTVLGPSESFNRRLNFAQSFNVMGAVLVPTLGATFILFVVEGAAAQRSAMSRYRPDPKMAASDAAAMAEGE
ncbi:MAG: hypothetical protein ACRD51_03440 [Candidatus Acidiferrum sp.]